MKKSHLRLKSYVEEMHRHSAHIIEAKEVLPSQIAEYDSLSQLERFALNTLIFRFSKLQDLLGSKVFRVYLDTIGFVVEEAGFFEILKEIEKEGIVDIDTWNFLRELRNEIAHDYPEEFDERVEKINLFIHKSDLLVDVAKRVEEKYRETQR